MGAIAHIGTIGIKHAAGRQQLSGTCEKPSRRAPRRDMDHINADYGIGFIDGPVRRAGVDIERGPDIGQAAGGCPGIDAGAGPRAWIARLNDMARQACAKPDAMLPRAACDFEQNSLRRQMLLQKISDQIPVAQRGWCMKAEIFFHGAF